MKNKRQIWNILVFPGGTEIGLEIGKSLGMCKEINLISASSEGYNHASFFFKNNYIVDNVFFSDNWIDQLNTIIISEKIDYIIPANALVIDKLIEYRNKLSCKTLLSDSELVKITRSKSKTYEILEDEIPVPIRYTDLDKINNWPVHIKPNSSYGSQGIYVAHSSDEIRKRYDSIDDLLIQEYLTGIEYTVDCFSDKDGKLLFAGSRVRERIRMGTTMHSFIPDDEKVNILKKYAEIVSKRIPLTGIWFFQMKENSQGELKLLEVEARIAGTMCFEKKQ